MKDILRRIYYLIIKCLPAKLVINFENMRAYRRPLSNDKEKVQHFGEKIQYLKLHGNLEEYNDLVDKYLVRNYIKDKIGEEYLIPIIGAYDSPEEINYDRLPNKFVLKGNHGAGYNIIVKDKKQLDKEKTNKKLKKWINEDYSNIKKEYQYKNVKRKIVCEEFISDKSGDLLDYKFFCFNGTPLFVKVDVDRYDEHKINLYDMEWNKVDIRVDKYKDYNGIVEKPCNFDKMVEIATKLSEDFQFVRVDLYNVDGKIYFGELTFTPGSGKNPFYPLEKDLEIASMIEI